MNMIEKIENARKIKAARVALSRMRAIDPSIGTPSAVANRVGVEFGRGVASGIKTRISWVELQKMREIEARKSAPAQVREMIWTPNAGNARRQQRAQSGKGRRR